MFCFVKYIKYEDFQKLECSDSECIHNKQLLINPDCFIGIILDYIYLEAGISTEMRNNFDLATEKGKLLNINDFPPETNGQEVLTDKLTYYIVQCRDNQIKPMLSTASKELADFKAYQRKKSLQEKRHSARSSSCASPLPISESQPRKSSASSQKQNQLSNVLL